jgi:hypothetical protein
MCGIAPYINGDFAEIQVTGTGHSACMTSIQMTIRATLPTVNGAACRAE